jgi:hypothetical protein
MKRQVLFGVIFSAALAVGVAAQSGAATSQDPTPTPPTQQDPTRPPQQDPTREPAQSSRPETITVTGCLESADAAPTGTSGTAGTSGTEPAAPRASGGGEFKLTNATMGSAPSSETEPEPTGTSGASASSYRLQGEKDELQKYVNSRVEIRGRLDSSRSPGSAGTSRPESAMSGQDSPRLHVESVRQISASCSGDNK